MESKKRGKIIFKMKRKKLKKVGKDFSGVCELRQLPKGACFRTLKGKETYTKSFYDRASKSYSCTKHSDVWGSERWLKGTTKVKTNFIY